MRLSVSKTGEGSGTVVSTPPGIECGATCTADFKMGTMVQLSATPDAGSLFAGWSGACMGTGACDVTLASAQAVTARFDRMLPPVRLTVSRSGPGASRIVSDPPGIDCGATCMAQFPGGTKVRLRLLSDASTYLVGWTGACTGYGPCEIDLRQEATVNALFHNRLCPAQSFCWDSPYPAGDTLTSVIGFGPNEIWAVGARGTMLRWNGVGWLSYSAGHGDGGFISLWGTAPDNLFAATENGPIYRWNGTRWSVTYGSLNQDLTVPAMFGFSPTEVWAGGRRGRLYRFNGTGWSVYGSPTNSTLNGLWGFASNNIWSVGTDGAILRWNGSSWSLVRSDTVRHLYSVWGPDPDNVWAVGDGGTVLRWNGTQWQSVSLGTTADLARVWGLAADDVWIVGNGGKAYHFDGTTWKDFPIGTDARMHAIWGQGKDLWAVGALGTIARFDGTRWTLPYEAPIVDLRAAWGVAEDDIWGVGALGTIAHFDGYRWARVPSGTTAELLAVWGSGPRDVWVAGEGGTVLRWDGTQFRPVAGAARTARLRGISGTAADDVWIVGSEGILHWNGTALMPFDPTLRVPLAHVLAVGRGDMWAGEGLLVHEVGGQRTLRNVPQIVTGIWGTGPRDVWVGYENGSFQRYDGNDWSSLRSVVLLKVNRYFASGPNDLWALGENGKHARWNGTTSFAYDGGFLTSYTAAWGKGPAATWLLGINGTVVRFKP